MSRNKRNLLFTGVLNESYEKRLHFRRRISEKVSHMSSIVLCRICNGSQDSCNPSTRTIILPKTSVGYKFTLSGCAHFMCLFFFTKRVSRGCNDLVNGSGGTQCVLANSAMYVNKDSGLGVTLRPAKTGYT